MRRNFLKIVWRKLMKIVFKYLFSILTYSYPSLVYTKVDTQAKSSKKIFEEMISWEKWRLHKNFLKRFSWDLNLEKIFINVVTNFKNRLPALILRDNFGTLSGKHLHFFRLFPQLYHDPNHFYPLITWTVALTLIFIFIRPQIHFIHSYLKKSNLA